MVVINNNLSGLCWINWLTAVIYIRVRRRHT
jgi:hypothetical protein